ncbi:NUDIX domain-containing protein [Streptomyces sp. NPDC087849]|uniref:NUDIX domain-containing protein n=1 Tax=unclassified Streptomyces TaxID=2593676 RepID=UPI00381912D8
MRTVHNGGTVDEGESPAHAAAREVMEELGIATVADRGLAVDWVSADGFGARPSLRFPGEIVHVFDGGTWDEGRIAESACPITRSPVSSSSSRPGSATGSPPAMHGGLCPRCAPGSTPPGRCSWRTASRSPPPSSTASPSCTLSAPSSTTRGARAHPRTSGR